MTVGNYRLTTNMKNFRIGKYSTNKHFYHMRNYHDIVVQKKKNLFFRKRAQEYAILNLHKNDKRRSREIEKPEVKCLSD